MILGLDVGGTHTDAVLIEDNRVIASHKTVTDHSNLFNSMNLALEEVSRGFDRGDICRVNLSTTLSTNAIVEERLEDVGMIISSGPGINPASFAMGKHCHILEGSIDHRGTIVQDLKQKDLDKVMKKFKRDNLKVFGAVTKFSIRNPHMENQIATELSDQEDFITLGHKLSGQLSFPRRVATAYYNSAVWRIYNSFADATAASMKKLGIDCRINILKADGGTMPLEYSRQLPVESILSGPAASILGILALSDIKEDAVILDIGGTTTDIAIFVKGEPLIEREGISFQGRPTLVRSLETRSIGIGGDSLVHCIDGEVRVGPERRGPAMAEGGDYPTLVDAFNYRGIIDFGDRERSIEGITALAKAEEMHPDQLAYGATVYGLARIKGAVDAFIEELNDKPVYTIHDMIDGTVIAPKEIYAMGGPVRGFAKLLEETFSMEVKVPDNFHVANAIGAALAKTTLEMELFADTGKGDLVVPGLGIQKKVSNRYSQGEAEKDAREYLFNHARELAPEVREEEIEIIESSSFKMVSGYFSSGRDLRVKCQIKPGVVAKVRG